MTRAGPAGWIGRYPARVTNQMSTDDISEALELEMSTDKRVKPEAILAPEDNIKPLDYREQFQV